MTIKRQGDRGTTNASTSTTTTAPTTTANNCSWGGIREHWEGRGMTGRREGRDGHSTYCSLFPHSSPAPTSEGGLYINLEQFYYVDYYVYNVSLDQLASVDNWLWPKPAITGCQTGPDHKELASCGPVQLCIDFECGQTSCGPSSFQQWKKTGPNWTLKHYGLTVFQLANNLVFLGIASMPECIDVAAFIDKNCAKSAFQGLQLLGFNMPHAEAVYAAFCPFTIFWTGFLLKKTRRLLDLAQYLVFAGSVNRTKDQTGLWSTPFI